MSITRELLIERMRIYFFGEYSDGSETEAVDVHVDFAELAEVILADEE